MIQQVTFESYKVFKDKQTLELKPITILIGKNSSGKSAILRLLTMLAKSIASNNDSLTKSKNEPLVYHCEEYDFAGNFKDLIYKKLDPRPIKLNFSLQNDSSHARLDIILRYFEELESGVIEEYKFGSGSNDDFPYSLHYKLNLSKVAEQKISYQDANDDNKELDIQFTGLSYALRYKGGLGRWHRDININYLPPLRPDIERFYNFRDNRNKNPNLLFRNYDLLRRVSNWYETKMNINGITVKKIADSGLFSLLTKDDINLKDIGQGIGQSLPIVTHALRQSENTLHIIEQPELHLHPAAHGDIAELIAESTIVTQHSKFVIETHSENFILRLRRLIAEKKLPAENVVIYWVDYKEEAEASQLQKIEIRPNGDVSFWPKGIFSEDYEEIKAIGKAQQDQ